VEKAYKHPITRAVKRPKKSQIPISRAANRRFNDNRIFPSVQFITDGVGLDEKTAVAALWCLHERGHIELKVEGSTLLCRRLFNGGRS
jgi:hypothetical protein